MASRRRVRRLRLRRSALRFHSEGRPCGHPRRAALGASRYWRPGCADAAIYALWRLRRYTTPHASPSTAAISDPSSTPSLAAPSKV